MSPCKECLKQYHVGELKERLKWQHIRMKVQGWVDKCDVEIKKAYDCIDHGGTATPNLWAADKHCFERVIKLLDGKS